MQGLINAAMLLVIVGGKGKLMHTWNPLALCLLCFTDLWAEISDPRRSVLKAALPDSFRIVRVDYSRVRLCQHVMWHPGTEESVWKWALVEHEVMFWDRSIVWSCAYPSPLLETGSFFVPKNRTKLRREGTESQDMGNHVPWVIYTK